jgi:uncharacterized membrane protein
MPDPVSPAPPAEGAPQDAPRAADGPTRALRAAALAAATGLVVLGLGWELAWAPTGHKTLALKVLPLVAALPGLARHRLYTSRWLSLLVWLYVAEGLVRLSDRPPAGALAAAEVALGLALFAACAAQVRWRLAAARRRAAPAAIDPAAIDPGAGAGTAH